MKTPSRLDGTMKIRMPEQMAARLERVADIKSKERGLRVGVSSIVREIEMESNSVRLLWDEVQRRLPSVGNTTSMQTEAPKVEETPLLVTNSSNGAAEKVENSAQNDSRQKGIGQERRPA